MNSHPPRPTGIWIDDAEEARRCARKPAPNVLLSNPVPGTLVDISVLGVGVETQTPLPVLAKTSFALDTGRARVDFYGEVRWCRLTDTIPLGRGEGRTVYRSGIVFIER